MLTKIMFRNRRYKLVFTKHALGRMEERDISRSIVEEVLRTGKSISKKAKNKYWVFKRIKRRIDNDVCLSVSLEDPTLLSSPL